MSASGTKPETRDTAGVKVGAHGLHYAWIVAGVTFATLVVGGALRGSPGILVVPLETEFGWSRATISLAVGINIFLYGFSGPFAAALMESFGLRRTMLAGLAAIGLGVLATPLMNQIWQLVLLWGVVVGAGSGMIANVLAATVSVRWFVARRGLVVGVLTASAAGGQLLFLPLFAAIAASYGWRCMALTLAAVALGLVPLVWTLMRDRPEDVGLGRYGEPAQGAGRQTAPPPVNPITAALGALAIGLRSRNFWLIGGAFFICGASTNGLIGTHLIPACIDHGIPEVAGASLLAGMALFNFLGGVGSGWLTDRVDARILLLVYYGLRGLSLIYLPFAFVSFYGLSLFAIFYGLDWIATVPPTIRLTANTFGAEKTGMIYGWITAIHQLGGASAALVGGILRVDLGTYLEAFILSGLLCLIAAGMVMFITPRPATSPAITAPSPA
jgi:sugar phosphate permease